MGEAAGLIVSVLFAGAIAIGIAFGFRRSRNTMMPPVPRVRIADIHGGQVVRVVGVVRAAPDVPLLASPLDAEASCVAYEVRFNAIERDGWVVLERAEVPFVLDDGTGTALVEATGAVVIYTDRVSDFRAYTRAGKEQLRSRHPDIVTSDVNARWLELVIQVGGWIAVQGVAERIIDVDQAATGYREQHPTKVRFVSRPDQPLYVNDRYAATGSGPPAHLVRES